MPISRRQTPALIIAIIAVIAVIAAIFYINKLISRNEDTQHTPEETIEPPLHDNGADSSSLIVNGKHDDATDKNDAQSPEKLVVDKKQKIKDTTKEQATAIVENFNRAIVNLDPTTAGSFTDKEKISYATLAGLCIIFEEGHYQLIKENAVRNMFLTNNTAGWIVRVKSPTSEKPAMLAISTKRKTSGADWKITEINLDKLLANYATQLTGGDVNYIPLIKNPQGGDSIVLYFQIDSKELTKRTERQLSIIANLLKSTPEKKLTISGHTDATGADDYNLDLSNLRAKQIMFFLTTQGIDPSQMEVVSFGKSKPRQPNTTDDGRRANRRAEILLDF